jgi:phage gp45-like
MERFLMDIATIFDKLVAPLRRRVRLMISRAVLAAVNDAGGIQLVQVKLLDSEVRDGVERLQNYGFTSVPKAGAEGLMACISGDRDHGIVVAMDDRRFRLKGLQAGEVALYTDEGDKIVLKRGRIIQFTAGTRLEVNSPLATFSGDVQVTGDVTAGGISLKMHTHGGVQTGGSNTGGPQ